MTCQLHVLATVFCYAELDLLGSNRLYPTVTGLRPDPGIAGLAALHARPAEAGESAIERPCQRVICGAMTPRKLGKCMLTWTLAA